MTDKLRPVSEEQAENFAQEVTAKGLPIGNDGAMEFARFFLQMDPPDNLLSKLATASGFIDTARLQTYLAQMTEEAARITRSGPYYLILQDTGRSGQWMYEQLRHLGLSHAAGIFASEVRDSAEIDDTPVGTIDDLCDTVPNGSVLLAAEDWSLGVSQMEDLF